MAARKATRLSCFSTLDFVASGDPRSLRVSKLAVEWTLRLDQLLMSAAKNGFAWTLTDDFQMSSIG